MKIIDLTQRSPAWHDWRKSGVTATDASILLGSPYKTPWRLWAEKRGLVLEPDLSANPHVQRGIREEPEARRRYEERHGDLLLPVCAESTLEPIVRASFDGLSDDGCPVELKAPSEGHFKEAITGGTESVLYRRYYPQVQTQIFVAEAEAGTLSLHFGEAFIDLPVPRDETCIGEIVERARTFWECVRSGREPPLDPNRDLYNPHGPDHTLWRHLAAEYRRLARERRSLVQRTKALDTPLEELERQLLALMGEFTLADSEGLRISRYLQQGALDYQAVLKAILPELTDAVLEPYRRNASERVRITLRPEVLGAGNGHAGNALAVPAAAFVSS
jgi:putative phage-type endonuclease